MSVNYAGDKSASKISETRLSPANHKELFIANYYRAGRAFLSGGVCTINRRAGENSQRG